LATRLRSLRANKQWTQEQAAREIGTTVDNLALIEKGRRHPRLSTLSRIARAYGVGVEELISLEEESTAPLAAGL
jgi:transcriptional regulator with XRE-family HTH domain